MVSPMFAKALAASGGLRSVLETQAAGPGSTVSRHDRIASMHNTTSNIVAASVTEAKWDARYAGEIPHTPLYYAKCMLGGALACGLTHTAVTPLDVAKCNAQVNPKKYGGLVNGMRTIIAEEGSAAVWKGWLPTFFGYSMQGLFKFGLYEYFKDLYSNIAGEEDAKKYRGLIWCLGSASAEFFADIALCPLEMVKVKVQTSPVGTWPVQFGPAIAQMNAQRAETRFPFGSVVPLWSRQIPYTVAKFFFFEKVVSLFYTYIFTNPKESYSTGTQLGCVAIMLYFHHDFLPNLQFFHGSAVLTISSTFGLDNFVYTPMTVHRPSKMTFRRVTFASGYSAGVICAIVSHPADSMVSQLGKAENKGKSMGAIAREVGMKNMMTKGLGTRILMIGTLTGLQWYIYDQFKTSMGMGTTGGK